jgi:signal transduction histidine kinase
MLYADVSRRQNLYLAMLVVVVALLVFGTYVTARTVRRELEVARMKSEFVSTVSHEFRSPLTGIRQLAEMLMRGRVRDEGRRQQYYRLIANESDRLSRLVESVLDFSRMEEGRKEYRLEPLEPVAWLEDLLAGFRTEVADKGVQIAVTMPEQLPLLMGDREALNCAVHNLLDNAVKYSPNSKTVWLEAEPTKAGITIRVRDQGQGVSEEDRKHIFEKFYRGGEEGTKQVKGAGLGLSLVKHIVSAHGGAVECESRPGEGSTFTIHLKAAPEGA